MKKSAVLAMFLCVLLLLAACSRSITTGEAVDIAAAHLRAEYEGVAFLTEEAECTFHEFDERSCYFVDIPGGHHVYRVSVDADTGAVIEAAMCK